MSMSRTTLYYGNPTTWLVCSNAHCGEQKRFVEDLARGDVICRACGRVAQEKILDMTAEWREFDGDDTDKARAETVDDALQNTSTLPLPASLHQKQPTNPLVDSISRLGEFIISLDLKADVKTKAFVKSIYTQFSTNIQGKKVRGGRSDAMLLAVLFVAMKECQVPRTFKELGTATGVDQHEIKKMCVLLKKHAGTPGRAAPVAPFELVLRLCSQLSLPEGVKRMSEQIARNVSSRLEGRNPMSIAAASVWMAAQVCRMSTNEREIGKAASVAPSTIKNIYAKMKEWPDLIPNH